MRSLLLAASTLALSLSHSLAVELPAACLAPQKWTLIPAEDRPATRYCESLGHLNAPAQISPGFHSPNLNDCISACKATSSAPAGGKCISFGYSSSKQTCTLYSKRLIDQKYKNRKTDEGTLYSNMLCYTCGCPRDAIQNGGFETAGATPMEAANWTYTPGDNSNDVVYTRDCSGGNNCVAAFTPGRNFPHLDENLTQTLSCLVPGATYEFSFTATGFTTVVNCFLAVYINDVLVLDFDLTQPDDTPYSKPVTVAKAQAEDSVLRLDLLSGNTRRILNQLTLDNFSMTLASII